MMGIGLDVMGVMITFVILVGVLLGKKNSMNEYFPPMLLMNALAILMDMGCLVTEGTAGLVIVLKTCWVLRLAFAMCGVVGFNMYVDKMILQSSGKTLFFRVISLGTSVVVIILWLSSLYTGWFFKISESGETEYGKYYWMLLTAAAAVIFLNLFRIISHHISGRLDPSLAVGMYLFAGIPMCILPISDIAGSPALLYAGMTVSYLTMYITIHVKQEHTVLEEKVDNEKIQNELVISQLQPHFIFNALTAIKYLCKSDPIMAVTAMDRFTKYLRRNLDVISDDKPITFAEELEHTKNYLWLEQLRFKKNLNVEYSIDCEDFLIPPLTIQPIVENAIKHGITKKIGGGKVSISVREADKYYKITISDDGVGFDKAIPNGDKDPHIGIEDVRRRLNRYNGSTLTINSVVGVGTSAVYQIQK